MNFINLIKEIELLAVKHNLVSSFVEGDNVFEVNSSDNLYPVVYLTSKPHQLGHPTSTYNFYIYYVDRLLEDKSNRLFIQNAGMKAINDLILDIIELEKTDCAYPIAINTFTEKFTDECAGVWAEISIESYNDMTECNKMSYSVGIITEDGEQIITENQEKVIVE